MDNSDKIKMKHLLRQLSSSIYGLGPIMSTSKRLSWLCSALDLAGKNFKKEYKERVLKSLYTNNKRKMKGIPMRRKVLIRKWWRALK